MNPLILFVWFSMVPVGVWVGGSFGKSSHFVAQLARITCKNSSRVEFQVGPSEAIREGLKKKLDKLGLLAEPPLTPPPST